MSRPKGTEPSSRREGPGQPVQPPGICGAGTCPSKTTEKGESEAMPAGEPEEAESLPQATDPKRLPSAALALTQLQPVIRGTRLSRARATP